MDAMIERKKYNVIYNDTASTVNKLVGIAEQQGDFLVIDTTTLGRVIIPLEKVVRLEEVG